MFAVKSKIYGVPYNQSSSIALMKHIVGQCQKAPYLSAFLDLVYKFRKIIGKYDFPLSFQEDSCSL